MEEKIKEIIDYLMKVDAKDIDRLYFKVMTTHEMFARIHAKEELMNEIDQIKTEADIPW